MKKLSLFFALCSLLFAFELAFGEFVVPPLPQSPVYDEVGFLTSEEQSILNQKILALEAETKHEIGVAILKSLQGYEPVEVAVEIGRSWWIGKWGVDNGLLFLIMPVGDPGEREAFIATGRGLEGVIPDLVATRIVDENLIPHFQNGDNLGGFTSALDRMTPLLRGEVVALPENPRDATGVIVTLIFWLVWGSMFLGSAVFEPSKAWWPGMLIGSVIGGLVMWFAVGTILSTVIWVLLSGSVLGGVDWAFSTGKIKAINSRPGGGRWGGGGGFGGGSSWGWGGFGGGGGFSGGGGGGRW